MFMFIFIRMIIINLDLYFVNYIVFTVLYTYKYKDTHDCKHKCSCFFVHTKKKKNSLIRFINIDKLQ